MNKIKYWVVVKKSNKYLGDGKYLYNRYSLKEVELEDHNAIKCLNFFSSPISASIGMACIRNDFELVKSTLPYIPDLMKERDKFIKLANKNGNTELRNYIKSLEQN